MEEIILTDPILQYIINAPNILFPQSLDYFFTIGYLSFWFL